MQRHYKLFKILHMKKELKEIYANQLIEHLAFFIIGIFIPVFLLESGFTFIQTMVFMLIQWSVYIPMTPVAAKINARIGVKHTILLRSPLVISYLAMVMNMDKFPFLYWPASIAGGTSLILYWTSINTEYVRTSDKRKEGEEAGMLYGMPYLASVMGPVTGALILTLFGFSTLFAISVILIFVSVVPLFLSDEYRGEGFATRWISIMIDRKKAFWYVVTGMLLTTDFLVWSLFVFVNYGIVSLGIAASLSGLGMIIFTFVIGRRSNTIMGRRKAIRLGGILCAMMWLMRAAVTTELQAMLLSMVGGFVMMSCIVPLYADFARFAKGNGPARSVAFRQFWLGIGYVVPTLAILMVVLPLSNPIQFMQACFVAAAAMAALLLFFRE